MDTSFTDVGGMDMYAPTFQTYQTGMEQYNLGQMVPVVDYSSMESGYPADAGQIYNIGQGGRGRGRGQPYSRPQGTKKVQKAPQPLFYCEICKISCAGQQPYSEHLNGQKHKKKENAVKSMASKTPQASIPGATVVSTNTNQLYCQLCDVACGSAMTYESHVNGAKHLRVLNLHSTLGKPIPEISSSPVAHAINVITSPTSVAIAAPRTAEVQPTAEAPEGEAKTSSEEKNDAGEIIGAEYIEEIRNDRGVIVSYTCKLCDCSFTDPNSNSVHLKGRRHRLQYKKKVNSSYFVEMRPSARAQKLRGVKMRRLNAKEEFWRQQDEFMAMRFEMMPQYPRAWTSEYYRNWKVTGKSTTLDDKYTYNKHAELFPEDAELDVIMKFVVNCENALKLVSNVILAEDETAMGTAEVKPEPKESDASDEVNEEKTDKQTEINKPARDESHRLVRGAMRVGLLAKALLLRGEHEVQMVLLSAEKPTSTLLERIYKCLPEQLKTINPDETYEVQLSVEDCSITIVREGEITVVCTVTLTSPLMNEDNLPDKALVKPDPVDMLDKQKCLDALAALRRAKWFQVRASGRKNGLVAMRVLRDLRRRNPVWWPLDEWAYELLIEKCLYVAGAVILGPGEILRSFFESLSTGLLLPDGCGILDPCEKIQTNVAENLTNQEREDITASAQTYLRQIVYRQIHKVLGVEKLPRRTYKRRRNHDESATVIDDKKMKEDNGSNAVDNPIETTNGDATEASDIKVESTE